MMLAATIRSTFARTTISAALLAAVAACGGTTDVTPPPKDIVPATITAVSTDVRGGVVGGPASLGLAVIVKNKAGEPITGATVTFAAGTGSGSVGSPTAQTDAAGQATTTWTLGQTVGPQTATATAVGLTPVTFQAIATVGPAAALTKVSTDPQTAQINTNVAVAPSVKLADSFGNPVAGALVTFTVGSGGGLVNGGAVNTNAAGVATVASWRLGASVGANTLVATSGTLTTTFTATATVGAAATLTLTPATLPELLIGQTAQLAARVVDASGNVLTNPTVTYTTTGSGIVSVSATGLITATGAGNTTVTATSGAATATVAVTVIGHPTTLAISNRIDLGGMPGAVAFTNNAMLAAISGLLKVAIYDQTGTTQTGLVTLTTSVPILLAPTRASGPAVAIDGGGFSKLWFIDPATAAVIDSGSVVESVANGNAAITTDGRRIFFMQGGDLVVLDGTTHAQITRLSMGGGVTKLAVAPGDTLMYGLTSVGVIFEIDIKNLVVKRQIPANASSTDFAIGRDGLFYLLDGTNSLVRLFNVNTGATVRTVGVSGSATSIAISPDGQQFWLTHITPAQVTVYTGNSTNGFISTGAIATGSATTGPSMPLRIFFSPSGSFAAVTNFGGWIDVIR